ncbi:DUF6193 family natural product biosynthesis protein [Streptomyces sp. NPDC000410]|uniref:DUF6193 family natural product biosynthesis protein n=1 Tax=Streptomyces sp. NPDC000410 TaxID=3154254 RepID=UPI003332A00A
MDAARPSRSHDDAWAEMFALCGPPHQDPWAEAMWPVIQVAARDELLRSMYPWLAMCQLYVSEFDDMRDRHEPFPRIAARGDHYVVIAYPPWPGHVLFETEDPAEAVALAAGLTREALANDSGSN